MCAGGTGPVPAAGDHPPAGADGQGQRVRSLHRAAEDRGEAGGGGAEAEISGGGVQTGFFLFYNLFISGLVSLLPEDCGTA